MNRTARGFTLIELLVVIAIIAILAAILFPVFVGVKAKGQQTTCSNNLRQVAIALLNYSDDWQGCLPGLNAFGDLFDNNPNRVNRGPMWRYVKTKQVYGCPADIGHKKPVTSGRAGWGINFTYTINGYMTIAERDRAGADTIGENLSKSANARKTVLLVDENTDPNKNESGYIVNDALFIWEDRTGDRHPGLGEHTEFINGRKVQVTGIAPVCYLDTHVGILPGLYKWNQHPEIFKK